MKRMYSREEIEKIILEVLQNMGFTFDDSGDNIVIETLKVNSIIDSADVEGTAGQVLAKDSSNKIKWTTPE